MRCLSIMAGLRRHLLVTSAAIALAALSSAPVAAANIQWTGGGGTPDWSLAGNWSTSTVPTSIDAVTLNNGLTPVLVNASGTAAKSLALGSLAGQTGTLTVDGAGRLAVGSASVDYFLIGDRGTGTVTVSNGGKVTSTTAVLGNYPGTTGTVIVTGTGSEWTTNALELGDDAGATGNFRVENGGKLTLGTGSISIGYVDTGATGILTIDGAGSGFTQNSGIFIVGRTGSGTFNVQNGATATTNFLVSIGSGAASRGFVNVSGAGSQWSSGTLQVGGATAQGTMTISNGGTVVSTATTSFIAAAQLIGTGAVTVTGADSLWKITGNYSGSALVVNGAAAASRGLLRIENGGRVLVDSTGTSLVNSDVRIGLVAGAAGKLEIDGANSVFTTPYRLFAGWNNNSIAQITVSNGGALNTGAVSISSAADASDAGADSVLITGPGSVWTVSDTLLAPPGNGEGMTVGASGRGILTLRDGGTVRLTNPDSLLVLGGFTDSQGTLNIGAAPGDPAAAPGQVDARAVVFTSTATAGPRTINFNHTSSNYTFGAAINGGAGTVNVLSGTTIVSQYTFTGTTNISAGATLQMGTGNNMPSIGSTVVNDGTLVLDYAGFPTFQGGISGAGALVKNGAGQIALEGTAYTYTGGTQVNAGSLAFGILSGTTPQNGAIPGNVTVANGTSVLLRRATSYTYAGVISGDGAFQKEGAGRVTLTGANTFLGGTTIWSGVLAIGADERLAAGGALRLSGGTFDTNGFGQTVGNLTGTPSGVLVIGSGRVTTTGTANTNFTSTITGTAAGAFIKQGSATLTLTATSSFAGATTVNGGTLLVNGGLAASSLTVNTGGTLGGSGTVGDTNVTGGTLRGIAGQTLTLQSLTLANNAVVTAALNAPSPTALFGITNNLTLGGTLNISDAGGYGAGVYRLMNYGGALTDNGLTVGSQPAGTDALVQTAVAQQVNLVVSGAVTPAPDIQFWNGSITTANGAIDSGPGSWTPSGQTNWTDANGARADAWNGKFAVFQASGTGGPVTVAGGGVSTQGMQFIGDWRVSGDPITLAGSTPVRVGDGSAAGASSRAVIGAVLTGTGTLVKDDLGTLVLAADNSYAGGTTIANGTLVLGDGGAAGSVRGDIANNATLVFNRNDASSFAGAISGTGAVQVAGGTVSLTGANSYTGGTAIASGAALRLQDGGSIGGNVANNGTLVFSRNADTAFTGAISGSGAVQIATGTVSLTGVNSYTGGTAIANGATLRMTDNGIPGDIANSGTLVFNPGGNLTYAGVLSGTGLIRQQTPGTVTLTGNSGGFAGVTSVAQGTLAVNGALGGTVAVENNGRLQGTGTVGGLRAASGATIAPGNSIGTLSVGNITFASGSVYEVEVDAAGNSDRIAANGTATLQGGTVQVLAGAGNYGPNTSYTILTAAGGVNGQFGGVTSNLAFLTPTLGYGAGSVTLNLERNALDFASVGGTPNQRAAGAGVQSLDGAGSALYDAVLRLDVPGARAAFDQVSGEIHASLRGILVGDSRWLRDNITGHLNSAQAEDGPAIWATGFGGWRRHHADGNAARISGSTGGITAGADLDAGNGWRLGAAGSYSRSDFDVPARTAQGGSDSYQIALYGGGGFDTIRVKAGFAYGWHDIATTRTVTFSGFSDALAADYGARSLQLFGEASRRIALPDLEIEPFLALAHVRLDVDGFGERGGSAALTARDGGSETTFTTLGLRMAGNILDGLRAHGSMGWGHAFGDAIPAARFALVPGRDFTIAGAPLGRNAAVMDAGLGFTPAPGWMLDVSYAGEVSGQATSHGLRGTMTVRF